MISNSNIFRENKEETDSLKEFIEQNSNLYSFEDAKYQDIFQSLLGERLYDKAWVIEADKRHFLLVLQAIRILTRDKRIIENVNTTDYIDNLLDLLAGHISKKANHHYYEDDSSQEVIVELISINKRLLNVNYLDKEQLNYVLNKIYHEGIFHKIMDLTDTNHPILLRCALEYLIFVYDASESGGEKFKAMFTKEFEDIHYLSQILMSIETYQQDYKSLAINLLTKITDSETNIKMIKKCFGFTIILNALNSSNDNKIKIMLLNFIKTVLQNEESVQDLRSLGIINLMLILFNERKSKSFYEKILILNNLHLMCYEHEASIKLHDLGMGVLLKALCDIHPLRRTDKSIFNDVSGNELDGSIKSYILFLFRTLRYIFAVERNRKLVKQVYPPRLFALFVDVGNYVSDLEKYMAVLQEFNKIQEKDFENFETAVKESLNSNLSNDISEKYRKVGNYYLIQQLGKGAFGIVYLGKKGENEFAIKELKLSEFETKMDTLDYENGGVQSIDDISKEVKIYKELSHPHIIKYYESFIEGNFIYIIIEYIDGFSLSDLIKLQAEKGAPFKENQIWNIIISMCSVLKYLHIDKKIVHRDLSPSNILIDRTFRVKLADFGLAKKVTQSVSNLKSFVGTLAYTSPEVIENKPYTEKADVWSLGCLAYEMLTLKTPFHSTNPLMLAKKIVDGDFEKIENISGNYSEKLIQFTKFCMTNDPSKRPSISDLLKLVSDEIIDFTNRALEYEDHLNYKLSL